MKEKTLLGALLLVISTVWATPTATVAAKGIGRHELKSFIADPTYLKPGDKAPPLYLTEECTTEQWNLRNLPAPTAGIHWTHMSDAYVLVNDADVKIIKVHDGKIFYHW